MIPTTTAIKKWWNAKSETFSRLGDGDTFTHGQVILMHLFVALVFILCCLAELLEGGTL